MRVSAAVAVVRRARVSLRGPKDEDEGDDPGRKTEVFRLPADVRRYLAREKLEKGYTKTETVVDACRLHEKMGKILGPHKRRIEEWARARNLTLKDNLPEVLAALTERGLDAEDPPKKR